MSSDSCSKPVECEKHVKNYMKRVLQYIQSFLLAYLAYVVLHTWAADRAYKKRSDRCIPADMAVKVLTMNWVGGSNARREL